MLNTDNRGVNRVEGDIPFITTEEADDIYDTIEWVAAREWCNGKVAMHGTAFAGVMCWHAAAKKPPSLACIAPWEGFYDTYGGVFFRGGIFDKTMMSHILTRMFGTGGVEDVVAMAEKYEERNGYWADKTANVEDIDIPIYATANVNMFHCNTIDWSV